MIDAGIFDGDFVVARSQTTATNGDIVVAGIGDEEATIKYMRYEEDKILLIPANPTYEELSVPIIEVTIYGRVVTVLRKV